MTSNNAGSPSEFLRNVLGQTVTIRLTTGTDYRGRLLCLDARMNVALEQADEITNNRVVASYPETLIRGNNGRPSMNRLMRATTVTHVGTALRTLT
ncbi:putative U6 snRNA-associated Sm-like protein [Gregarina niphandrodes]|uniref:U6 snRNA-associated Sm-like protein n=1 Tax=Gregarina niphandrodes TaxID=110365 RepID=A0A023B8R4_GRENI|nr:putative U6 snRNA-associated Sm-like protein [Gregarina niphandrodes]EZG69411.1 putative U6 snRNA-associated Sm-like protein [Gregarina niphandrodes]|eukprot:XP_011130012.1 putative U6 snRNA-associated Sm-like protein [Gregarina niphandrodes]